MMTEQFKLPFDREDNIMEGEKIKLEKSFFTTKDEGYVLIDQSFINHGRGRVMKHGEKSKPNDETQPFVEVNEQGNDKWGCWTNIPGLGNKSIKCYFTDQTNGLIAQMENPNFKGFDPDTGLPVIEGSEQPSASEDSDLQEINKSKGNLSGIVSQSSSVKGYERHSDYPEDDYDVYKGPGW